MDKENVLIILMSLFLGFSSLAMGISQITNSEATDKTIESIINYENSNILSDYQAKQLILMNSQLSLSNSKQINRNYACLTTILAEKMVPFNQTLYEQIKQGCIGDEFGLDIDYPNLDEYNLTNPIENYNKNLEKIYSLRTKASIWQMISIFSFILGVGCMIMLFTIKSKLKKHE